jgi:VanZ family protein
MVWLRRTAWGLTAVYWGVIFALTHMPPEQLAGAPRIWDKLAHFLIYFLLAVLLGSAMMLSFPQRRSIPLWVLVVGFTYGIVDELLQPFVRREATLLDWVADALGVWLAVLLLWALQRMLIPRGAAPLEDADVATAPASPDVQG